MSELSPNRSASARKNEQKILNLIANANQKDIAAAIGVDESTITRAKTGAIPLVSAILAYFDTGISEKGSINLTPEKFFCITEFAKDGANLFFNEREALLAQIKELTQSIRD